MKIKDLFKRKRKEVPKSSTELELEKRLKHEVIDARKLYTNRWVFRFNIFGQDNVHEFYYSSTHFFVQDLQNIKSSFLENANQLQESQNKLYHYIMIEGESFPEIKKPLESIEVQDAPTFARNDTSATISSEFPKQKIEFTKMNSSPKEYVKQAQQYESQVAYGAHYADLNLKKAEEHYKIENISLPYKASEVVDIPKPKSNMLASATKPKVLLTYVVVLGAIIPELMTFSRVLSRVFHIESGFKQFFLGFTIVLLSKVFSILFFGTLLEFLKRENKIFKLRNIIVNQFALFLAVIGILLCTSLGALYYQVTDREQLIQKIVMLQQNNQQIKEEAVVSETPLDEESKQIISDNTEKIKLYKKQLEESESKTTLKVITISLFSAVVLLFSSSLFAFAWMFSTVYYLQNRVEQLSSKLYQLEGRFHSQRIGLQTFQKKIYNIFRLLGELEYLRRLREGFSNDFEIFDESQPYETTSPKTSGKTGLLPLHKNRKEKRKT